MFDGLYAVVMSGSLIGIFLQVVPITFLVGLVYAIYRLVKIRKRELSVSWGAEIMRWLFVCYLTGLINLVLVPRNFWTYIWFYLYNGYSGGELAAGAALCRGEGHAARLERFIAALFDCFFCHDKTSFQSLMRTNSRFVIARSIRPSISRTASASLTSSRFGFVRG